MVACSRIVSRRHPRVVGVAPSSAAAVGNPHEKRRTPTSSNCSNHTIVFHADSITHRSDDDAVAIAGYRNTYPISFTSTSTTTTSSVHNKTSRSSSSSSSSSTIASSTSTTLAIDEPSSLYLHNAKLIAPFAIRNFSALLDSSKFEKQQELLLVEIFNILQEIVPYYLSLWNIEHPNQLVVRTLQGGLSNYLLTVQPRTTAAKEFTLNYNANNQNLEGVSSKAIIPSTILIRIHEDENASSSSSSSSCSTPQKYHHEHFDLVNRCMENHISAVLSSKGMAPTYFGRFQNGRLEEFFENVRPLIHLEMKSPVFCKEIARKLGKFHNISCKDLDWDNGGGGSRSCCDGNGVIWARIDEWLQVAKEWYNCSKNNNNNNNNNLILSEISKEWTWLKGQLMEVGPAATRSDRHHHDNENVQNIAKNYCRELVFAHMDCQSLNILTRRQSQTSTVNHDSGSGSGSGSTTISDFGNNNQDTDDNNNNNDSCEKINGDYRHLQFIDFEYAGINPRAADIGNTFCEFCDMNNLVPDYAKEYPSDTVQNVFIMSYIRANNDALATKVLNDMSQEDRELFLYTMRQEIGKYSLISHLGWAVWSLIQNKQSSIEFDYIRYAEIRMDGYHMFKNIFW